MKRRTTILTIAGADLALLAIGAWAFYGVGTHVEAVTVADAVERYRDAADAAPAPAESTDSGAPLRAGVPGQPQAASQPAAGTNDPAGTGVPTAGPACSATAAKCAGGE
ncbi:MAG TPA: hypothetical protein VI916_01125 [Acidimicrobiia bacterium]|nr:hypothetical protein [Acidimicrobiia bacterium]